MKKSLIYLVAIVALAISGCTEKQADPVLEARLSNITALEPTQTGSTLYIYSNYPWRIVVSYPAGEQQGWCRPEYTEGEGEEAIKIATGANALSTSRSATVQVITDFQSVTLTLTQEGTGGSGDEDGFYAALSTSTMAWNDTGITLGIETDKSWGVTFEYPSGTAAWCTATPASGSGDRNVAIAPTANNTSASPRTATVVVTPSQGDPIYLGLTQTANSGDIPYQTSLSSNSIAWNASSVNLTITTAGSWSYSITGGSWCTPQTGSGTGTTTRTLTTTSNTGSGVRFVTITVTVGSQSTPLTLTQSAQSSPYIDPTRYELPRIVDYNWLIEMSTGEYAFEYDTAKRHPKWTAHQLLQRHRGSGRPGSGWHQDSRIPDKYSAHDGDYDGYSKGHLVPSADRNKTAAMNRETFIYANASPQIGNTFNGSVWNTLENKVRSWISDSNPLYICTGGSYKDASQIIGYSSPSKMVIPKYYFKVILRKRNGAWESIGFWMENKSYSSGTIASTMIKSVDDIELLTGLDFFYLLPQPDQENAEKTYKAGDWGL